MKSTIHQFLNDRRGNFGILSSLLLPVLLGAAGLAVDVSSMMLAKQDAQNYADGAAQRLTQ